MIVGRLDEDKKTHLSFFASVKMNQLNR